MKRFLILLIIPLFFACQIDTTTDYEAMIADLQAQIDEQEQSEPPVIEISPDGQVVSNSATATFTAKVLDVDDIEFMYIWAVDGVVKSETDILNFSASPEWRTDYTIALTVSDGSNLVSDSVTLTVLTPAWTPTRLHIYIFAIDAELADETAEKTYIADDAESYAVLLGSVKLKCESMNLDGSFYIIEGGV